MKNLDTRIKILANSFATEDYDAAHVEGFLRKLVRDAKEVVYEEAMKTQCMGCASDTPAMTFLA